MISESEETGSGAVDAPPEHRIIPPAGLLWPWAAALSSAGVPYHIDPCEEGGLCLVVPVSAAASAEAELREYHRVNRDWPHGLGEAPEVDPVHPWGIFCAFLVALCVIRFYLWTGPATEGSLAFRVGALMGDRVLSGEWWRSVTALTLHVDGAHVLGNSGFCLFVGIGVSQFLGSGVGWLCILLTGVIGNWVTAFVQPAGVVSVGASTAAFGSLGLIVVLHGERLWRLRRTAGFVLSRSWVPLAAGVGLLAFLGVGPRADLAGHAFGFCAGLGLGALGALFCRRPPGWFVQAASGCVACGLLVAAWRAALAGT